jgi:hypothetical protein
MLYLTVSFHLSRGWRQWNVGMWTLVFKGHVAFFQLATHWPGNVALNETLIFFPSWQRSVSWPGNTSPRYPAAWDRAPAIHRVQILYILGERVQILYILGERVQILYILGERWFIGGGTYCLWRLQQITVNYVLRHPFLIKRLRERWKDRCNVLLCLRRSINGIWRLRRQRRTVSVAFPLSQSFDQE